MASNVFFAAAGTTTTAISIGEKNEVANKKEHRQSLGFDETKTNIPQKNNS
jgi:hypothetical protein